MAGHHVLRSGLGAILAAAWLSACGGSQDLATTGTGLGADVRNERGGRIFRIEPGPNATMDMVLAMIEARPRDTIEFAEGYFELSDGLQLSSTEDILIRGAGIDKTVLSFKHSTAADGVLLSGTRGITIEDLTVLDTPGNGVKMQGVDHATIRRVRTLWSSGRNLPEEDLITAANWRDRLHVPCTDPPRHNPNHFNPLERDTTSPDYTVSDRSGRYGIYPVNSQNILVEYSESVGASDAGIYVGQTDNAIIRHSRAAYNVFGMEIENVRGGEYFNNIAECNTGGFLVYDLAGLTRYGDRTIVHGNIARNNNTYNFATPGTLVGDVPRGSGLITLGYDKIDIFDNVFENNGTAGILHVSYATTGAPGDRRLDMYTEGVHIFRNTFRNNGNDIPTADFQRILASGGEDVASAFSMLLAVKVLAGGRGYRGAHIAWDGQLDDLDPDCPYPTDDMGQPIPADASGKPIQGNQFPNPSCRYNAYKFDREGQRIKPEWFASCIANDNQFSDDSVHYANFRGRNGLELLFALPPTSLDQIQGIVAGLPNFPAIFDMAPHDCPTAYGRTLPRLPPVVIPPFVPSGNIDPAPAVDLVERLCNAVIPGNGVNLGAVPVNCPRLDQYQLFLDPQDPTSLPRGNGVPYALNSKLFTDYSTKYRVVFLPPGQQATYRDGADGANATILFPVGTVIAKTFTFVDDERGVEVPAETRLLIKRQRRNGQEHWDGLEYVWGEENGQRVARLTQQGGTGRFSWNFRDVDSGVRHRGSTNDYGFPNANQCLSCHANDDAETGAAPIGPKARNWNRVYASESPLPSGQAQHPVAGENQILWWCQNGLMRNCPSDLELDPVTRHVRNVERVPVFNIPGDSGFPANSPQDIEARARAYLEINCAHCHNPRGGAQNTGFYTDVFRPVDDTYGICKSPTASGNEGRGGRDFDIVPGSALASILSYRMGPGAQTPTARMPPLARTVVHDEAVALIDRWIDEVIDSSYPNADACRGGGGLLPGLPTLPIRLPVLGASSGLGVGLPLGSAPSD